jgi:hypothetical protein
VELVEKHHAELEALRQRHSNQMKALKKQLEAEEARLRSRQSDELRRSQQKEMARPKQKLSQK